MDYNNSPQSESFLRDVLARNPGHEAKGQACLAVGQRLKHQAQETSTKEKSEALSKEAETLLERVTKEFADIKQPRGTTGDVARNVLNEFRNLGIGKTAPRGQRRGHPRQGDEADRLSGQGGGSRLLGRLVRAVPGHVPTRAVARGEA